MVSNTSANVSPLSPTQSQSSSSRWILGVWKDLLLFTLTPLLIVPLVVMLQSRWVQVDVLTISLVVAGFGGLGHHLPGMIRAYGDRDLFQRFRWRFILAPIFLLAVCIPLSEYHLNAMYIILSIWGCWHALMQVYGFVRIYDVKVGSVASITAMWDWLMCLSWFSTAQVVSNGKMARMLEYFYNSGGPLIPPTWVHGFRLLSVCASIVILLGFSVNYLFQVRKGPSPNPVKLLMLATGIGFWWFAMVYVENIILGIALFEIFHDIQYLAIVWLYNCRRVDKSPEIGPFMRFLFRRGPGLLSLYIGLVFAYGLIAIVFRDVPHDGFKQLILGLIWASTVLHFYFDGFIWKVRDKSTRQGLGLVDNQAGVDNSSSKIARAEFLHLLKWSPLVVILIWLSSAELIGSSVPGQKYAAREWSAETQLERVKNIAESVPGDMRAQRRAAITMANVEDSEKAVLFLKQILKDRPKFAQGYQLLGEIHQLRGQLNEAKACYLQALAVARSKEDLTIANHRLGEVYRAQNQISLAKLKFQAALKVDPTFEGSIQALQQLESAGIQSQ